MRAAGFRRPAIVILARRASLSRPIARSPTIISLVDRESSWGARWQPDLN